MAAFGTTRLIVPMEEAVFEAIQSGSNAARWQQPVMNGARERWPFLTSRLLIILLLASLFVLQQLLLIDLKISPITTA